MFTNQDPEEHRCYLRAIRLISRRDYSEFRLREKLKDFQRSAVDSVVNELREDGYLNDSRVLAGLVRSWGRKGSAPSLIQMKLRDHGLSASETEIDEILEEAEILKEVQLEQIAESYKVQKDIDDIDNPKVLKRILGVFHRKGHFLSVSELKTVLSNANRLD